MFVKLGDMVVEPSVVKGLRTIRCDRPRHPNGGGEEEKSLIDRVQL